STDARTLSLPSSPRTEPRLTVPRPPGLPPAVVKRPAAEVAVQRFDPVAAQLQQIADLVAVHVTQSERAVRLGDYLPFVVQLLEDEVLLQQLLLGVVLARVPDDHSMSGVRVNEFTVFLQGRPERPRVGGDYLQAGVEDVENQASVVGEVLADTQQRLPLILRCQQVQEGAVGDGDEWEAPAEREVAHVAFNQFDATL